MASNILNSNNLGHGLTQGADKKLTIKIKPGSSLILDPAGLDVTIPPPVVPVVSVQSIVVEGNRLKVTDTDNHETYLDLPAQTVDVRLQGAKITEGNELQLELTNGDVVKTSLAKFIDAPKTAQAYWDEIKALPGFKDSLLALIKGEAMLDFEDKPMGYLLAK